MFKLPTINSISNSKIAANYFLIRLISTENKCGKQNQNIVNNCEADNEKSEAKSYNSIPGPKPAPVFGYLWHTLPKVGKYHGMAVHEAHIQYQKEYGNLVRLRELKIAKDLVLCYDPKDIETIFRNDGKWPKRDILPSIKYYREVLRPDVFQDYGGVFTSDDEKWQESRSIMNAILMQPRVVKHYINGFSKVADDFVERIRYLTIQNNLNEMPEDFNVEIMKWGLESIGILSLDTRFGLLENTTLEPEKLQYLDNAVQFFCLIYKIDVLPSLAKYFSTPTWKKYVTVMDGITNFVEKHINLTKERLKQEEHIQKDINAMSIIEKLIKNYDNKYIFGNITDLILGGVDTTSRTMGSILYLLAENPEKQEILRKEINDVLTKDDDVLTVQKLDKILYLRAVIKEAQRMIPVSVSLSRVTKKDLVLSGYHVPKGTNIVLEQLPLFWSEENFPEPTKFMPERWLRKDGKKDINPWILLSFGFGHRSCVGKRIAQLELEVLLTKIIQNYKMEWHYDKPELSYNLLFGISSHLKIRMIPVDQ